VRIYHGSRAFFDSFDPQFFGTGEGTGLAFWFIDNFDGADYHAHMISRLPVHTPRVYTCEFPDHFASGRPGCFSFFAAKNPGTTEGHPAR